ncbi:MAG: DnaA/Hda family protein [Gemmatimonadota bacterium]
MTIQLNPRYRFENYVVGSANRLAATAAKAVAESPGSVYNPLFIYAGSGLGKTHLLMAIGQAATVINPQVAVEYLTLDDFVESFHAAIAAGQGDVYRKRYTEVNLLLVDDIQFLTHRREMQAELLRLTNTMLSSGRQIVLSSDRPPNEIEALDERLIQRFAGGLVIDISAPDYETRVAILRRQAEERRADFGPGVIETVASLAINSIRELIGALNRLIAFQAVSDTPLDATQARAVLGKSIPAALRAPAGVEGSVVTGVASPGASRAEPAPDEFGSFLSEIVNTVTQQVDAWKARVAEAILRWEGEGYRTQRLDALLEEQSPVDPEAVVQEFVKDIERLRLLQAEATELDPALPGLPLFRDPDAVEEARALVDRARLGTSPPPGPSPFWDLKEFVEAASNRMALRAAAAVIATPGNEYNPLVITGGTSVGKTHLLHGIGNELAHAAESIVACLNAQDFIDELIKAIDRDRVTWWRARYRRITALLLDDIHLIAGKERTQEELFWLFNLLQEAGRQMVFTCALPLQELEGVEPRLITRLEGGLVVELPMPEREIRVAIVERLLSARLENQDEELVAYLSSRPADSIRGLQGLVQRVVQAADAQQVRPSLTIARRLLEGSPAAPVRRTNSGRTSGIVSPLGSVRSREKTVWDWPDVADRVIEDLR